MHKHHTTRRFLSGFYFVATFLLLNAGLSGMAAAATERQVNVEKYIEHTGSGQDAVEQKTVIREEVIRKGNTKTDATTPKVESSKRWLFSLDPHKTAGLKETIPPSFGLGYKLGNVLGFLGADAIVFVGVPRLSLDLQANILTVTQASGYGLAPAMHFSIFDGWQSTPYLSAGFLYAKLNADNDNRSAAGQGFFLHGGYTWRWASGIEALLGGGIAKLPKISVSSASSVGSDSLMFSVEGGVRYMFF